MDGAAVADLAERLGVDLVVVGPRRRWWLGSPTRCRPRDRGVRPVRRGRPARGLQGVRQGGDGRCRRPDRPGAVCTTAEEAAAALDELGAPYVVKDDGLAAGKGVVVTDDRDEALAARRRAASGC